MHYAALADNTDVLWALIQAGADPFIVNAQGFKPSQFAASGRMKAFKVSLGLQTVSVTEVLL